MEVNAADAVGRFCSELANMSLARKTLYFVRVFYGNELGMRSGPPWLGKSSWVPDMAPGASKCARDARCPGDSICELRTMS